MKKQHRIKQIRYSLRGGPNMTVYLYDGSKRTYLNVSEYSRQRLSNIAPEYNWKSPFEKMQNSISNPGFTVVRVRS